MNSLYGLYGILSSIVPIIAVVTAGTWATAELRKNEDFHAFIAMFGPEYVCYDVPIHLAMAEDDVNDCLESP